jgi:hypothetical protein
VIRKRKPIFHDIPAAPKWIPITILKAPKKRAILPNHWWYHFQPLQILASLFGLRKKANI